jgi:hypothetical protein
MSNRYGGLIIVGVGEDPQTGTPSAYERIVNDGKRLRKAACRDAMVDWLYSRDALSPLAQPARDEMLNDLHWGVWSAQPFSVDDLDAAAAGLHRLVLVKGMLVDACEGPVRLYLTGAGVACSPA